MALEKMQEGELLKWEETGKNLKGILKAYKKQNTGKGEGNVYEVKTSNGTVPFFAPQLLHKKLQEIAVGNVVDITYTKETKTGSGNTLKHFDVLHGAPTAENLASVGIEASMQKVDDNDDDIDADEIPV